MTDVGLLQHRLISRRPLSSTEQAGLVPSSASCHIKARYRCVPYVQTWSYHITHYPLSFSVTDTAQSIERGLSPAGVMTDDELMMTSLTSSAAAVYTMDRETVSTLAMND